MAPGQRLASQGMKAQRYPLEPAGVAIGVVDYDRNDESVAWIEPLEPVQRVIPFGPEIALLAILGILRQQRNEQRTAIDLISNLQIVGGTTLKPVGVDPHLEARRFQPSLERECWPHDRGGCN